ncbi:ciliogenesis and planar polarity effector 1 isoform X1 [Corythoichthys intestinalis]|uniref:ciliogenesis and planar polarity effector 1 isoform X1 n=1 Tax=Corythoichthys intestinalis TaxID=161448 RepID=UPI0025A66178|nr:ciliogenesis and planar polarity effector 1 isoform X1 [Corythoichthys intestinalis]
MVCVTTNMELKLDVVLSSSIKRKKPWPRFCWLGQEKESVFLFDDKRISKINIVSGRTKKKTPELHPLLNKVVTMAPSRNGMWFCGLLTSGELFLWNTDKDLLRTAAAVPEVIQMITSTKGKAARLSVHVSGEGTRILLVNTFGQAFLWECIDIEDLILARDGIVNGRWSQIQPPQDNPLPTLKDKEATQCNVFVESQVTGDICLSAFVFTSGKKLIITCLKIQWLDDHVRFGSLGYSIQWATKTYPLSRLTPPCQAVKSRGALVVDFSPDGQLLAVVLNQRQPKATQVLYVSTQNFVTVPTGLERCGCKTKDIPSKHTRSFWVGSISWSHDGLFLACVLKRGALLILARVGGLLTLTSSGCQTDFGPTNFLPLHPLVTYRPPTGTTESQLSSSSLSARDEMRQRYSVTWHPRLLHCIVSDGYMATVLRVLNRPSPAMLVKALLNKTGKDLQKACQLLDTSQSFLEDESNIDCPHPGSQLSDSERLEFASLFDTLHTLDTETNFNRDYEYEFERAEHRFRQELGKIQNRLLTVWALCMSLGAAVENRAHLLQNTVFRVVQLAALFHMMSSRAAQSGKSISANSHCIMEFLKRLFSFLPWVNAHSGGPTGLGLAMDLSKRLVHQLLAPSPESYPSACLDRLSGAVLILQLASEILDCTYSLQRKTVWSSAEKDPQLLTSDEYHVPLLQDYGENQSVLFHQGPLLPQRPSTRLFGVWQWVYKVSLQYKENNKGLKENDDLKEGDEERLSVRISDIQSALQASGEKLGDGPTLLSHKGEERFLCGMYQDSTETWRTQIWEECKKSCHRNVFQETRLCLALLYGLLSQYHLREAVELGEHMTHLVLHNAEHHNNPMICTLADPLLPTNLHSDAVIAVIQTLARFMASYFTNQPLNILPAHHVAVLPPLHLPHASNVGRLVPLCQKAAARAIRQQNMSEKWTVNYTVDLLLLGGLLPETVYLASKLGDWKTAASVSLAYLYYCDDHLDFTQIKRKEFHLPRALFPKSIFQAELQSLLDNDKDEYKDANDKRFTDPVEGQDLDTWHGSAQEILKASVIAGVDILTSPLTSLLDSAKDLCSGLSALVHSGLYLPSPPLYCPQPSPNTQDPVGTEGQLAEVTIRSKVSRVLQRILLLLKSARCCYSSAQWYVSNLRRARHLLHKIKTRYPYPSFHKKEKGLPENLMKFVSRGGFFRQGHNKNLETDCIQTIICFRELCGLCWMLHVRDQFSIACRKYQAARIQKVRDNSQVHSTCIDALLWARRYLPFSHFLNAEEIVQDLLLSLLAEMPPSALVADTLVLAFPEEEKSVRVSLREKYNSLLQNLRQLSVVEEDDKEPVGKTMKCLIQEKLRHRRKHLGRLLRHLAPTELRIWEKHDDEDDKHGADASVSAFNLTDCSDGKSTENLTSVSVSPDPHIPSIPREVNTNATRTAILNKKATDNVTLPSLPIIGTWEFELEDDEYLAFLELFLSYMLEKDISEVSEPPLLKSFCSTLRERELHSLTFDVLTTMHRRQKDGHQPARKHCTDELPVFRAGCCRRLVKRGMTPESQTSAVWNDACESRSNLSGFGLTDIMTGRETGLFSLRHKKAGSGSYSNQSALAFGSSTITEGIVELQQVLDPKLEAHFPVLGRLLEWMLRWADKRVLFGHTGKKKKPKMEESCQDGIVIRVKTSAPALLTSLSLLESRFMHLQPGSLKAQQTDAPMLQYEAEKKLEKESSVDTGYPVSTNNLMASYDDVIQQGKESICPHTDEPEELKSQRTPLPDNQKELPLSASIPSATSQRPCFDDLDITPEKEGKSSDEHTEQLSSLSNGILSENLCSPQASLKLEELIDMSSSTSLRARSHPVTVAQSGSIPQTAPSVQPEESVNTAGPHTRAWPYSNTSLDHTGFQPQTSTASAPAPDPFGLGQSSSLQAPPMRQRLGEDLYRLVQNINYMSLMDVLGVSFSNLQLAQQNSYLSQANVNPSHPPVPPSYMSSVPPPHNPQPVHGPAVSQLQIHVPDPQPNNTQSIPASAPAYACQNPRHSPHEQDHVSNFPFVTHDAEGIYQQFRPLSVQAGPSDVYLPEHTSLTPSGEGLLITANTNRTAPSHGNININTSSQASGLKLLQLDSIRKRNKQRTRGVPLAQKRHLRFGHGTPTESSTRSSRHNNPTSGATRDLRLLHVHPGIQQYINLPKLPSPIPPSKPFLVPSVPPNEQPKLQLLCLNSKLKKMSIPAHQASQKARLISLEELAGLVAVRRNNEEARLQLLRVNDSAETHRGTTFSSSKRQKRREGKLSAKLPNESIDTIKKPQEDSEEIIPTKESDIQRETIPRSSGSSPPVLTGHALLDKVRTTSAELHAFAATFKRPPECYDAFTNTEQECSPILVDKAMTATQSESPTTSPDKMEERPTEKMYSPSPYADITPSQEKMNLDKRGRNFLSVLDIEEGMSHWDSPPASSGNKEASPIPPVLTPAQLHVLATSLIKSAHPANDKNPKTVYQTEIQMGITELNREPERDSYEELPEFELSTCTKMPRSDKHHNRELEQICLHDSEDSTDSELSKSTKTSRIDVPHNLPSESSAVWFSSHLSKLDSQLALLQNIADCLEKDLPMSKMAKEYHKPKKDSPVSPPNVKPAIRKTVRLSLPAEKPKSQPKYTHISVRKNPLEIRAPQPQPHAASEPDICKEEEEDKEDDVFRNVYHNLERKPQASHPSSSQLRHMQNLLNQTPTGTVDTFDETGNDSLDQTGLSDTAEILEGLVREGYISQSDLEASLYSLDSSRNEQQDPSRQISPRRVDPNEDDERRELRMWMKCKQRERHSVYQKQRASLRERELKPFSRTSKSTSQVTGKKITQEKQKAIILKQFNQRLRDATSLAEKLQTKPFTSSNILVLDVPIPRSTSAPPAAGNHSRDESLKRHSGQTQAQRRPWTAEAPRRPSEDSGSTELQQRPGTSLSRVHPITSARAREDQLLTHPGELIDQRDSGTRGSVAAMDWLDRLSESGGNLSEVDWAAIERMATAEETS